MGYKYILMEKFNNKIEKHLELSEIADMLNEYKEYYNVYRRLLVINMVANGESIAKASKNINKILYRNMYKLKIDNNRRLNI